MARFGTSDLLRGVREGARQLQAQQMRPIPPTRNDDVDLMWWRGSGVEEPERPGGYRPVDDQLFRVPTQEELPESEPGRTPLWMLGHTPQWNTPSYWSIPFCRVCEICIPTWEQEYRLCTLRAGDMEMMVIRDISYHVISGLSQYDLFEMKAYQGPALRTTWEDMIIDPGVANPSQRYVFAGDDRPLPLYLTIDRNRTAGFSVKARGLVNLAGASNRNPGDPIIPNAHFRIKVEGWITPLQRNNDGSPRESDTGHLLNVLEHPSLHDEGL